MLFAVYPLLQVYHAFLAGVSETVVLNMSTLAWSVVTSVQGRLPVASEVVIILYGLDIINVILTRHSLFYEILLKLSSSLIYNVIRQDNLIFQLCL